MIDVYFILILIFEGSGCDSMTILMILLAAGCAGTPTSGSNTPLSLLTHLLVSQLLPSRTTVNYRRFRILTSAVFASPVQL